MGRRRPLLLLAVPLLAAGCAGGGRAPAPDVGDPGPVRRCAAPAGTRTDVAHEPGWRRHGEYRRWTTTDGCLVRVDVLADLDGPEHCGWQAARTITVGAPVGRGRIPRAGGRTYVRDPRNIFGDAVTAAGFDPHAELPGGAIDTGLRHAGESLWAAPLDPSALYLVTRTRVERWPLDRDRALCL